ncbi:MAG: S1 RNA-binding domain-containing protein [Anaerolineae bacterium]|nr:S1 RNA-binding domain-containing protein [Anaerolineae bacterium]
MSLEQNTTQEHWQEQEMQAPDWWELLVEGDYGDSRPLRGDIFLATILSIDERDIIVDIGGKQDGIIQERDLVNVPPAYLEGLEVKGRVPVRVITFNSEQGSVIVSLKQGLEHQDWLRAEELMESGEAVKSEINGINRGGVVASFGPLQGFIPNSHLTRIPRGTSGEQQLKMKEALIGQTVNVLVIEVDARRRRLILSERLAAVHQRAELLAEIHEGAIRTGVVSNIVDFGAFIDLGGVDGLLHISEISWDHVGHPSENLSIGDQIEVYVLDVDRDRERIALSRKRLLPDPWNTVTENLEAGDVIEGTVTHTTDFGAFVDIGSGVEGLAHVSEMPNGEQGLAALESNAAVKVRILHIDTHQRRVSLRIEADDDAVEDAEPDSSQDEPETVE